MALKEQYQQLTSQKIWLYYVLKVSKYVHS